MIPPSRWRGWPLRSSTCCPPYGSQREWLPTVAIASGVAVVEAVCSVPGSWRRSGSASGLDAQLGRFAFGLGNLAVSALTSAE
jgi:hypothetical protein